MTEKDKKVVRVFIAFIILAIIITILVAMTMSYNRGQLQKEKEFEQIVNNPRWTLIKYDMIKTDMTLDQVIIMLGKYDNFVWVEEKQYYIYSWIDIEEKIFIEIIIKNGRVINKNLYNH